MEGHIHYLTVELDLLLSQDIQHRMKELRMMCMLKTII